MLKAGFTGNVKGDRTGTGTYSVFGKQIEHNMEDGFPALTTKRLAWHQVVSELLWFLRGSTDIRELWRDNTHIWDGDWYKAYTKSTSSPYSLEQMIEYGLEGDASFSEDVWNLGPIYGAQWRRLEKSSHAYIDQISDLVNNLKKNPDSRRLVVNAWNVRDLPKMTLPPCHYGFEMYTSEISLEERQRIANPYSSERIRKLLCTEKDLDELGIPKRRLSLRWIQRSADIPLGLPFNLASYALLLEIIAKEVNMLPYMLIGSLGDCHVYRDQMPGCVTQLHRKPRKLPKLFALDEFHYLMDIQSISFDEKVRELRPDMFKLENYDPYPAIKFPLSN